MRKKGVSSLIAGAVLALAMVVPSYAVEMVGNDKIQIVEEDSVQDLVDSTYLSADETEEILLDSQHAEDENNNSNLNTSITEDNESVREDDISCDEDTYIPAANMYGDNTSNISKDAVKKYNIKFNANGGKGKMTTIKNVKYGKSKKLTANKFTRRGYKFKGWATSKAKAKKGKVKYKNKAFVKNLTKKDGKTVTLYAVWEKKGNNNNNGNNGNNDNDDSNDDSDDNTNDNGDNSIKGDYVLNTNTKKFHYPSCSSVSDILPKNRKDVNASRDSIIAQGYAPCKRCKP